MIGAGKYGSARERKEWPGKLLVVAGGVGGAGSGVYVCMERRSSWVSCLT